MRSSLLALVCASALAGAACGGAQTTIPADALKTTVSLAKIDCADCGEQIVEDLRKRPGVYEAGFNKRTAELVVVASPTFDVFTTVRQLASVEGFDAILGSGKGKYLDWATFPEGADVQIVAKNGEDVPDLKPVLAAGKITVVDFSAVWCEPCRKLDDHMVKVLGERKDVAYRKLDIGDWDTPLAKRYLKSVPALPYTIIYGADGVKVQDIAGLDLARVDAAIGKAAQSSAPAAPSAKP